MRCSRPANPCGLNNIPRRNLLQGSLALAASVAAPGIIKAEIPTSEPAKCPTRSWPQPVKAFCIDFNWGPEGAAPPGMYTQADPAEHVRWYQELGANVIQTFCVSYNGYAWYPSEVAPVNPGLKQPDWLGRMVELGHKAGMMVLGYFCLGANPYWEKMNPGLVHHDDPRNIEIPQTLEYIDYFCRSVEDLLRKVNVDGFMIDWIRPTRHRLWIDCEKEMYRQLLGEKFPASGRPSDEAIFRFDRLAMERAWQHIRWVVRATRPAIVWTNHPFLKEEIPLWTGQPLLKEVDWLLNESPEIELVDWLRSEIGPNTLIVQNLCGWQGHDANVWKKLDHKTTGFYGYAKADAETTFPSKKNEGNIKNIEILREAYHKL